MKALFFNAAGVILFERSDDESATVQHEELTLQVLYPYRDDKVIQRGMRIGYQDALGDWQVYEIRKAKTYEQDHYQEITAENICVSELTDEHFVGAEWTNTTASAALGEILTGTGWAVGTVTASNTSSANANTGNVWQDVRTIENNWNVYILPRITVGSAGITGKYLDIVPSGGTWRGLRLSLDKNCDEVGVTWDDSNLKTALYAYGAMVEVTENGETVKKPLTIKDVVWQETADHPAKQAGVEYLEDPAATAAFGRNGRPRFGYYQNGDISDANVLIEKTWESLKTLNAPEVTVDCLVTDLYRLGYVDVPLRLHDTALIEVRPTGVVLQKEIIQYTEDLNDPTQSRLVIGAYIPNIIYINHETNKAAGGGGGGGGGQTNGEYEESLFVTQINANEYGLSVTSAELQQVGSTVVSQGAQLTIDRTGINSLAVGTGAQLNADGTLVVDAHGNPVFTTTGSGLYSKIEQNADAINLRVVKGDVATQLSVECGNVSVTGGNLTVDGYVTSAGLATEIASLGYVECATMVANTFGDGSGTVDVGSVTAEGEISCDSLYANEIDLGGDTFTNVIVSASVSGNVLTLTPLSGNAITFSKATTLTSGWSSGAYTVTATQNSETVGTNVTALTNTGHWGSGSGEDPNKYYYATYATINGGATPVATGNTTIIDATARYTAGASSVTISSATRTNESNSALTGDSSVGTAGYKYIVITATASNGATRTIAVNATPTYDAGVTAGEGKFTLVSVDVAGTGYTFTRYGYDHLYYYDDDTGRYRDAVSGSRYWYYRSTNVSGGIYYTKSTNSTTYYTKASS